MSGMNQATANRWSTLSGVAAIVALVYGTGTEHFGNAVAAFLLLGFAALIVRTGPEVRR